MPGYPEPKVALLPTFYLPRNDRIEAVTDSTPIITRLDRDYPGPKVRPGDPLLRFLDLLIEDYADEWLTKAMFHYRWAHEADAENAGPLLAYWLDSTLPDEEGARLSARLTKRQQDRLTVVGSNAVTAEVIEESYHRFLRLLDRRISDRGFVLGARPGAADFAIYGQMTQLGIVEPTSAAVLKETSARVRAWIDRVEDLSGLAPVEGDWLDDPVALRDLLSEIGRTYVPALLGNAAAVERGDAIFETQIDGRPWQQSTFPYQAKCLVWLREVWRNLPTAARDQAGAILAGTGCDQLFA
jgi:glutathione S-transferase